MRRSSRRIGESTPGIFVISAVTGPVRARRRLQVGNVNTGRGGQSTSMWLVIDASKGHLEVEQRTLCLSPGGILEEWAVEN